MVVWKQKAQGQPSNKAVGVKEDPKLPSEGATQRKVNFDLGPPGGFNQGPIAHDYRLLTKRDPRKAFNKINDASDDNTEGVNQSKS